MHLSTGHLQTGMIPDPKLGVVAEMNVYCGCCVLVRRRGSDQLQWHQTRAPP